MLVALALLGGCGPDAEDAGASREGGGEGSDPAFALRTDSAAYTLRRDGVGWRTSIGYEYRNPGPDTVFVVNCNGDVVMNLQKLGSGGWEDVWLAETNACLSDPIVIPPGEALEGRMSIWGAEPGTPSVSTFATDDFEGEFRLAWHQPVLRYDSDAPNFGQTVPLEERVSNPFTLSRETSGR